MLTKLVLAFAAAALTVTTTQATVYFKESFDDAAWSKRWVQSAAKDKEELGAFKQTPFKYEVEEDDKALKTSDDVRFYAMSAKMPKVLNNKDKDLYISYVVANEQNIDCGGAYLKLLPKGLDQAKFSGDSPYSIMFGPDICGQSKTHAILNYARPGKDAVNMDHKNAMEPEKDQLPHLYSLIITKDNKYDVLVDTKSIRGDRPIEGQKALGDLAQDWPFQPPKEIEDPEQSKPKDWVDDKMMDDPEDKKPEGWDDIPKTIPDPDAKKPEDWDDEDDGEWEPGMIENPEYKGEWKPRQIENPKYKGEWVHPKIANPEYFEDDMKHYVAKEIEYVGFDLWQVKSGTLFDDILITDDEKEYKKHEETVMKKVKAIDEKKKEVDAAEEAERKLKEEEAEKKRKEEEAAKKEAEDEDEDEDEDDKKEEKKDDKKDEKKEEAKKEEKKEDKKADKKDTKKKEKKDKADKDEL